MKYLLPVTITIVLLTLILALVISGLELLSPSMSHQEVLYAYGLTDQSLNIDGLKVFYQTVGDPQNPTIVTLHGWGGKHELSFPRRARWMKLLADNGFYVIAPEHPGLIRSQTPPHVWNNQNYADYVEKFVSQLNLSRFVLHGQSFGGLIAMTYVTYYPDKVKGLILSGAAKAGADRTPVNTLVFRIVGKSLTASLGSKLMPEFIKKLLTAWTLSVPADHQAETHETRALMGHIFADGNDISLFSKLPSLNTPTLLVWGRYDWKVPLSTGQQLQKLISNSRLVTFPAGHLALYQYPEKVIESAKGFVF